MYIFYILNDYNIEAKDNQKNEEEMERERERRKTPPSLDSFSVPGGFSVLTGDSGGRPP